MHVGSLKVRLRVREARSLKDKRQVVLSIKDRLRNQFNVAAAEVDALEDRQLIVLGFAAVGPEAGLVRSTLDAIVNALRAHPVAEFIDQEMDA
jgi:uncharacterized protein YlxP (DUF503 family)